MGGVSQLRGVEFWPATAFADVAAWLEDPDEDAFVRTARSVCELYSEALRHAAARAEVRSSASTPFTTRPARTSW